MTRQVRLTHDRRDDGGCQRRAAGIAPAGRAHGDGSARCSRTSRLGRPQPRRVGRLQQPHQRQHGVERTHAERDDQAAPGRQPDRRASTPCRSSSRRRRSTGRGTSASTSRSGSRIEVAKAESRRHEGREAVRAKDYGGVGANRARSSIVEAGGPGGSRGVDRQTDAGAFVFQQLEKLHARARVVAERTEHRRRDRVGVLLLHAAHRHAQVRALAHDRDAERVDLRRMVSAI